MLIGNKICDPNLFSYINKYLKKKKILIARQICDTDYAHHICAMCDHFKKYLRCMHFES